MSTPYLAARLAPAGPQAGEAIDADEVARHHVHVRHDGRPKGAMLTHANLWWNNVIALLLTDMLESDVSLVVAPLFHIGGLNVTTLQAWMKGAENVLHRSFDPGRFIEDIARYGVTVAFAVPAMLLFVTNIRTSTAPTSRPFAASCAEVPPFRRASSSSTSAAASRSTRATGSPRRHLVSRSSPQSTPLPSSDRRGEHRCSSSPPRRRGGGSGHRARCPRRDSRSWPQRHEGLLEPAGGDGGGDRRRRLVPHRRCRLSRQRGVSLRGRPHQGHGHHGR